jgi:anaerobic magnesium-protoporphyrin IX monomethyl ester cyclase
LVNDQEDWYKYFKCSEIDPTCMKGPDINRVRAKGLRSLFFRKLFLHPLQTFTLLRRFLRYMPAKDIYTLLSKPFRGKQSGATRAEVLSRAVEHQDMKTNAADLTQISDEELEAKFAKSGKE